MRDLLGLSGPWVGLSIQGGMRLSEEIQLQFHGVHFGGSGTDVDGDFDLDGVYHPEDHRVDIIRTYSRTNKPGGDGVGVPFEYSGQWDGAMIAGNWHEIGFRENGGPFEMWPYREEDRLELMLQIDEEPAVPSGSRL
jgi:hypothetical protein